MTYETLLALMAFAIATSVTPGPNNMMLMASGANFGFRRTVPHMLGISIGHAVMVVLVGLGIAGVILAQPMIELALKVVSVAYMIWLAWKTAMAAPPSGSAEGGAPLTFMQAAAFQWVNPKAWAMALGAVTIYAPDRALPSLLIVAAVFATVNLPSVSLWAMAGQALRRFLTNPRRLRVFNGVMAVMLLGSLLPFLLGGHG